VGAETPLTIWVISDRVWPDEGRDSFGVVTRKERLEL
jgi:hypothetical protein